MTKIQIIIKVKYNKTQIINFNLIIYSIKNKKVIKMKKCHYFRLITPSNNNNKTIIKEYLESNYKAQYAITIIKPKKNKKFKIKKKNLYFLKIMKNLILNQHNHIVLDFLEIKKKKYRIQKINQI